ncbi:MAG: MinD/ParA family protein [Defluviitaleaceae bacterium]|nr:MinD/ParA family protein [Defluviitaleaceae bacterium]
MDQANNLRNLLNFRKKNSHKPARVITVTSGKGGVGKTNFTVNLALYLQKQDISVVVVDADFGLANIEILLGATPKYSMHDVITKNLDIIETITEADSGLRFISGGSGLSGLTNVSGDQLEYVLENLSALDAIADVVLIDTGAGISDSVLKFVTAASETIIICAPEPTSITDSYSLVKAVKEQNGYIPGFKIVINRVEDKEEGAKIFRNLQRVASKFLSIELEFIGVLPLDNNLVKAVKSQTPCIISYPHSVFSREIERIGNTILDISNESEPTGMKGFVRRLANIFTS